MTDSLVTVAAYWRAGDAALAQGALTAAGIEADLASADRGVKLRVRHEDALRAAAVLDASGQSQGEIEEADEPEVDPTICQTCGSEGAMRTQRATMFVLLAAVVIGVGTAIEIADAAFLAILAMGLYFIIADRWRCAECGQSWN